MRKYIPTRQQNPRQLNRIGRRLSQRPAGGGVAVAELGGCLREFTSHKKDQMRRIIDALAMLMAQCPLCTLVNVIKHYIKLYTRILK